MGICTCVYAVRGAFWFAATPSKLPIFAATYLAHSLATCMAKQFTAKKKKEMTYCENVYELS
jgi:hypothetical protein